MFNISAKNTLLKLFQTNTLNIRLDCNLIRKFYMKYFQDCSSTSNLKLHFNFHVEYKFTTITLLLSREN